MCTIIIAISFVTGQNAVEEWIQMPNIKNVNVSVNWNATKAVDLFHVSMPLLIATCMMRNHK
jgi:hypothetical protein